MTMKIPKLKVRPRALAQASPCAPQLAAMLQCWAAQGDRMNAAQCAQEAMALEMCLANNAGRKGKVRKPTINYHLARLGKNL